MSAPERAEVRRHRILEPAELSVAAFMVIGFPHDGPEEMRKRVRELWSREASPICG